MMTDIEKKLTKIVLSIHRRNGGELESLDLDLRLLAPELGLDSMDLAEAMVAIEREFGVDPFGGETPPRTWREVGAIVEKLKS